MSFRRLFGSRLWLRQKQLTSCARQVRQNSKYVKSAFPAVTIPDIRLHERIFEGISNYPDHVAIECPVTKRAYTYEDLDKLSKKVALGFLKAGIRPGQVIAFVLPNLPEFILGVIAAFRAGITVTPINPLYGPDEILHQINDSGSSLVVTYNLKVPDVQKALDKIKGPKPPITVIHHPQDSLPEGVRSFFELFSVDKNSDDLLKKVNIKTDDVALLFYSSGTTGLPKGVKLSHKNMISNLRQLEGDGLSPVLPTTKSHQDVCGCVLPFFHVYGCVVGALSYLTQGCKLISLPKFEAQLYLSTIKEYKTSILHVVPPILQFLASHPMVNAADLVSVKYAINGAAAISPTDGNRLLKKKSDIFIGSGYGMTETSPVITAPKVHGPYDLESVGYLLPNSELKIISSENGEVLDPGTPGEICLRGPQVMLGYHNNQEATDKTIIDGWLHTGDMGYISSDGRLFLVDRLKELIKVKGFQVAPLEIEEVLRTHPGVADVGVVGKPDPRFGETPVAFVVATNKKLSAQELKDFVSSKVAEYKQLSDIVFIDEIPKNTTGKIVRRQLKELLPQS